MKDFFGKEIKVGDWLVYGTLLGRCAAVKVGKVLSVDFIPKQNWRGGDIRIGVIGCEKNYKEVYTLGKKGTLQFSDRAIVVSEDMVPEEIKKLYV